MKNSLSGCKSSFKHAGVIKAVLVFASILLIMCMAAGCKFLGITDNGSDPAATEAPDSIAFMGFEHVLDIPVGVGEGCIGGVLNAQGNIGIAELRAISDDEFIILDSANKEVIFLNREGIERTLSIADCVRPERVAYDNGTLAVLDLNNIVILNENGEPIRTEPLPWEWDEYYNGISVFEFQNGKLNMQLNADSAYELGEKGFKEAPMVFTIFHTRYYADVRFGANSWHVKNNDSPVYPIAVHGNTLLAMTYDDPSQDMGALAGVYIADTNLNAAANIDREGLVCVPAPNNLTMSPSGRVYLLSCFEDRVEISELEFE